MTHSMSRRRGRALPGDPGLTARIGLTILLLAAVYVAFMAVLFAAGGSLVLIAIVVGALAVGQYFFSDRLVLAAVGARLVTRTEAPELVDRIERLAASRSGSPDPGRRHRAGFQEARIARWYADAVDQMGRESVAEPGVEDVLGPLGAAVMRIAWSQGESTVGSALQVLNQGRRQPLAYTTVMTILGRLFERGLLARERRGRQFVYRPVADERSSIESLSGRAVNELLDRYGNAAMRHFAEHLADLEPDTRAELLKLAAQREP